MGETFWKALLLTLPHHLNIIKDIPILKDLPIPDGFKAIILLACLGIIIFAFRGRKEEAQKLPIKKTLPQPTAQSKNVSKLGTGKVSPERILCLDESCTGTIGDDGYCGYCGKPFTQVRMNKALKMPAGEDKKYKPIINHLDEILQSIPPSHINNYDDLNGELEQDRNVVTNPEWQKRYKSFYRLRGLSSNFCQEYFKVLQMNLANMTSLEHVVNHLYNIPRNVTGARSVQFSFASKLIHTVDPHSPIYDLFVREFYCFSEPSRVVPVHERIPVLLKFHKKLISEYRHVLKDDVLTEAIQQFRKCFSPKTFTDEKIIDSLIWAFQKWRKGQSK
ncbi:MAG: hypothetical protein WB930_10540 [Syntrophobacteraceae bacterium]